MQRDLPRYFTAYGIALVVYVSAISTLFYSQNNTFISSKETKEKVLKMSLSSFVPEVITPVKKQDEKPLEEVVKTKVKNIEIEPIIKPEIFVKKPEIKPLKKELKKKPKVLTKKIVTKKVPEKKVLKNPKNPVKKKTKTKTTANTKTAKKQATSKQIKSSTGERNKFFTQLRTKIDRHKSYPRIAKKRRMEGSVKVKFTILKNGKIGNISVSGTKIFYKSARNAVNSAFPISIKKIPITLPKTVNLTLRYQIR